MTTHRHRWEPMHGRRGKYGCQCGATGFRKLDSGRVAVHRRPYRPEMANRSVVSDYCGEPSYEDCVDAYLNDEVARMWRTR